MSSAYIPDVVNRNILRWLSGTILFTFISFVIFIGLLIYFKIHIKVNAAIQDNIDKIKQQVDNAEN